MLNNGLTGNALAGANRLTLRLSHLLTVSVTLLRKKLLDANPFLT